LAATGTPVDKTVHVSLQAIEAVHMPPAALQAVINEPAGLMMEALNPESITSVMLGLTSKLATFTMQRELNNYANDRLMAILPGVAMAELWTLMSTVENLLRVISALVLMSSLFGLATMLLASMNERQGEIAVLRVLGASPSIILLLILFESLILICMSLIVAISALKIVLLTLDEWLASEFGLFLSNDIISPEIASLSALVILATILVSLYPGIEAYKKAFYMQLTGK
jgi:putative ABC transport system permease protein